MLKGEPMKAIYAKTILYAYPKMEMVLNVLDDLAERKALSAFGDVRPCEELAQRIIDITIKKDLVIKLKLLCDFVINKMTPEDQMIINYKFHIFTLVCKSYIYVFIFKFFYVSK